VADLDMDGRFVVLTVPAIGIGVMVAPAIGGIFAGPIGYDTILWASGIAVLLAMIISLGALHRGLPLVRSNSC
jgi:predicted MFS family arabinose efflux permease